MHKVASSMHGALKVRVISASERFSSLISHMVAFFAVDL